MALFSDNFEDNSIGGAWKIFGGSWSESGGVLSQSSTAAVDPRKAVLSNAGLSATGNYCLTAKLRVNSWTDGAYARAGVGLFANGTDGYGYNLVFHNDHNTIQFHDDYVAWGPSYTFAWQDNVWYWFKLKSVGGTLYGKVWQEGTAEPTEWPYTWTRSGRSGYPSLNGGAAGGLPGNATVSFDDVSVSAP
jgi:hypothetical protein